MKIVEKYTFCGYDWHDMHDTISYLRGNNGVDVTDEDAEALIIADMTAELSDIGYTETIPKNRHAAKDGFAFVMVGGLSEVGEGSPEAQIRVHRAVPPKPEDVESNVRSKKEFSIEDETGSISADVTFDDKGYHIKASIQGYEYDVSYVVSEISDPVYFAAEEIYAPMKGAYTIRRTYSPPFATYEEAENALEEIPDHEGYHTGRVVLISDPSNVNEEWLENNLKAAEYIKNHPEAPFRLHPESCFK